MFDEWVKNSSYLAATCLELQQFLSQRAPQPAHWQTLSQKTSVIRARRASEDSGLGEKAYGGLVPVLSFCFAREEPIERGLELSPPMTGVTDQIVGMCGVSP